MYYGLMDDELFNLRAEYEKIFGYDPNGDVEIEISDHDEYRNLLITCVSKKIDMFEVLGI